MTIPRRPSAHLERSAERARFRALAAQCSATLHVILCQAPQQVLEARIAKRKRLGTDASEADRAVLALQQTRFEPILAEEGLCVIAADTTSDDVLMRTSAYLSG
jgi:uncharacterized protein